MVRWLDPVTAALDAAPSSVPVFFRDDDAGWSDDRLCALLDRFLEHGLPLDVAAIPQALGPAMARELVARGVAVHQHGLRARQPRAGGAQVRIRTEPVARRAAARHRGGARAAARSGWTGWSSRSSRRPGTAARATPALCLAELGFERALARVAGRAARRALRELPVSLDFVRLSPDELARRFARGGAAGGRDVPSRGDGRRRDGPGGGAAGAAGRASARGGAADDGVGVAPGELRLGGEAAGSAARPADWSLDHALRVQTDQSMPRGPRSRSLNAGVDVRRRQLRGSREP